MNNRLKEIIKYKTGGRQADFAALMGWTPQYLTKLLKGIDFGIRPILTIVSALPEINARWLLLGEGQMIDVRKEMIERMMNVLDIERYMTVMSPDELCEYEQVVMGCRTPDFSPEQIEGWKRLLKEREDNIEAVFTAATQKSERVCRRKRAKKS